MKKTLFKKMMIGFVFAVSAMIVGGCIQTEMEQQQETVDIERTEMYAEKESRDMEWNSGSEKESEEIEMENESAEKENTDEKDIDKKNTEQVETAASKESEMENTGSKESEDTSGSEQKEPKVVEWDPEWNYAENSAIHSGSATLYYVGNP